MAKDDITKLFTSLAKSYGASSVYRANELPDYDVVSTGSLSVDFALGTGGLPLGRVVEIGGENSVGKTLFALTAANNYLQKYPDSIVGFLDLEHRIERDWAAKFVKDMDRMIVMKPDSAESGIEMLRDLAVSDQMRLCIWDSISGAPTFGELEKTAFKQQFGGNSKIITTLAKFATTLSSKHNFTMLGINQIRQDIGGYNRYCTGGGEGWKHACSVRLQLLRQKGAEYNAVEKINGEEIPVGFKTKVKVVKSSIGAPGRVASYWMYNVPTEDHGFGIDTTEEVARLASLTGVVKREGLTYYHDVFTNGKIVGQPKLAAFLRANPEARDILYKLTLEAMQSGNVDMTHIVPMSADAEESLEYSEPKIGFTLSEIAEKARNS